MEGTNKQHDDDDDVDDESEDESRARVVEKRPSLLTRLHILLQKLLLSAGWEVYMCLSILMYTGLHQPCTMTCVRFARALCNTLS